MSRVFTSSRFAICFNFCKSSWTRVRWSVSIPCAVIPNSSLMARPIRFFPTSSASKLPTGLPFNQFRQAWIIEGVKRSTPKTLCVLK